MIHALQFGGGYPTRLPGIGSRRIEFVPGANLVVGHNGSGKSTLLRALAAATGCGEGGWSRGAAAPALGCEFQAEWDGLPAFYQSSDRPDEVSLLSDDLFARFAAARSSGERRVAVLNELRVRLHADFPLYRTRDNQRPTLLLDEADHHLGIGAQWYLWKELVPWLAKRFQLIVSSHSMFPLLVRGRAPSRDHQIRELSPGYLDECVRVLGLAVDQYNAREQGNASGAHARARGG